MIISLTYRFSYVLILVVIWIPLVNTYMEHGSGQEGKYFNYQTGEYFYETPQTRGYVITLKLSGDTAKFYKNSKADSTYRFKILKESDVTGWPDDQAPVIAFYRFATGVRGSYFRIKICEKYLVTEQSYSSDLGGDSIWERF